MKVKYGHVVDVRSRPHYLVLAVTSGLGTSSAGLTPSQTRRLIAKLEKQLAKFPAKKKRGSK